LFDLAAARPKHQALHALVADEHIRSAAEQRYIYARRMRDTDGVDQFFRTRRFQQPSGRTTDFEGRERRQRNIGAQSFGSEPRAYLVRERLASVGQRQPPDRGAQHRRLRVYNPEIRPNRQAQADRRAGDRR